MADEQPKEIAIPTATNKEGSEENGEGGEIKNSEENTSGDLTSPEGILMLLVAGTIDTISIIPVVNVISDILGIIIIGGWLLITRPATALKRVWGKFLIAIGIELVPVVSVVPGWTWFVFKILKNG